MKTREDYKEQLPFYAAGSLAASQAENMETHLAACDDCQAELALWRQVGATIELENRTVEAPDFERLRLPAPARQPRPLRAWWALLTSQLRLLRSELWTGSALVLVLGAAVALLFEVQNLLYNLAPLVAAAGAALLYGDDNDPAWELTLATPVSQVQLLLARLALVLGFNLLLVLGASGLLVGVYGAQSWAVLVSIWLAPMAFLSALALLLSLLWGSANAISIAYGLWILRALTSLPDAQRISPALTRGLAAFWADPALLFASALALGLAALLLVRYPQWQPGRWN